MMLRQNHQDLEGNDRYEGFCVDMLKELADILKFKYRIRLVGDGHYGVPGTNGTWTGMVGELISRVGWCSGGSQRHSSLASVFFGSLHFRLLRLAKMAEGRRSEEEAERGGAGFKAGGDLSSFCGSNGEQSH